MLEIYIVIVLYSANALYLNILKRKEKNNKDFFFYKYCTNKCHVL